MQCGEFFHGCGIEAGVVNAFGDFYIAFYHCFACYGTHAAYQVSAHITQAIGCFEHDSMPFL